MGGDRPHANTSITGFIRYAPYVEEHHAAFLDLTHAKALAILEDSPFDGYVPVEIDDAFFGIGYAISNFPSLYDMFGKFMAGFDVEILWGYIFEDSLNTPEINSATSAEMKLVDDNIVKDTLPDFQIMMRKINSVVSSSFVIGKSVIENTRVKALSKISAEAKFQMIPGVQEKFNASLNWGKKTVTTYAEAMKLYYMTKMHVDNSNYNFDAQNKLWPFTVLDFERAALGALQGTVNFQKVMEKRKRSTLSGGLLIASYAVTGAYVGYAIGNVVGAVVGAIIGAIIGLAVVLLE